jgi:hypothetical protein
MTGFVRSGKDSNPRIRRAGLLNPVFGPVPGEKKLCLIRRPDFAPPLNRGTNRMASLRKALCSVVCALTLSATAPAAPHLLPTARCPLPTVIAESWSWGEFWKFWKRQLDRTAGVVGVVLLVGAGATVIILSKSRRSE